MIQNDIITSAEAIRQAKGMTISKARIAMAKTFSLGEEDSDLLEQCLVENLIKNLEMSPKEVISLYKEAVIAVNANADSIDIPLGKNAVSDQASPKCVCSSIEQLIRMGLALSGVLM